MGTGERHRKARRWPRRLLLGVLAFLALFYAGGGWYFSSVLNERALDAAERRASTDPSYDLTVTDVGNGVITLTPMDAPPDALTTDGTWGLRWKGGYAQVGDVTGADGSAVTRSFRMISGEAPTPGTPAELDVRAYPDPASAGVTAADRVVRGPLGDYPAWFVVAPGDVWAIVVHGNSMSRLDNARILPALHDAGYPTLTITYRNDAGAPEDPSGRLGYGLTEWRDLEAAVGSALDDGAEGVVLVGDSMGGGVIADFLIESPLSRRVRAVVLDAPMLNFSATVDDNASREPLVGPIKLPASLTAVAKWIASWRFGVSWDELNYLEHADRFTVPFLVFHGEADTTVPIATSRKFAASRPDLVTLVTCPGADHIECWNLDPHAYEERMVSFLREHAPPEGG